jgi:hypothetical protein
VIALAVVRALGSWLAGYATCGAWVGALLCGADHGLRGSAPGLLAVLFALGLGAGAGALAGCKLGFVLALAALVPPPRRALVWGLAGLALALLCARALGVLERLSGAYAQLAWVALIGLLLFAALSALLGAALAPADISLQLNQCGLWRLPARRRNALLLALPLATGTLLALDHVLLVGSYPFVHALLQRSALLIASAALLHAGAHAARAWPPRRRTVAQLAAAGLALAAAAFPLAAIGPAQSALVAALRSAPLAALALDDLRAFGDVDDDGFALWLGGGDCAPFDPAVHPGAPEQRGNGVDDNCRLGDRMAPAEAPPSLHWADSPATTSIVLITVDALRADHLGSYGYARATSPHIDAWFRDGLRFADAIAPGAYTTVTMPALMRGKHARALAWSVALQTSRLRLVRDPRQAGLAPGERWISAQLIAIDDARFPTLAQRLLARGYRTAAVVDDGGTSFLAPELMGAGFERYVYVPQLSGKLHDPRGDELVAEQAIATLATLAEDPRPFLLWLHFYGVHAPDAVHEGVPSFGSGVVAGYDHEIAHVDQQLKRVFAALDAQAARAPLVTLLSADHGERMYGSGRAHGSNLGEDEIHVPLLLRGTGIARGVVAHSVSLLDVLPTVLALCGARELRGFDGADLLAPGAAALGRSVLSDVWRYDARGRLEFDRVAAVAGELRLVFDLGANAQRVYRRKTGALVLAPAPALERAAFEYLERTGPRVRELK